jgi:hypothetical protein
MSLVCCLLASIAVLLLSTLIYTVHSISTVYYWLDAEQDGIQL